MDWLKLLAAFGVLLVAVALGGATVRLTTLAGQRRPIVALGVVALLLGVAVVATASSRRWLSNPYW